MNRFAYLATGQVIAFMEAISKVHVNIHGRVNIPEGSLIFVVNHFTRIETLLLPYHVYQLTKVPVWSLADPNLFNGALGSMLETVGAVSTEDPHRDRLIVKSLLTGEANWIIFPEGCMVKDKAFVEHARYAISCAAGRRRPHTGAATLALRTEFYRRRLRELVHEHPAEAVRLQALFGIDDMDPVLEGVTRIVPVNITYYPLRARENAVSRLASRFFGAISAPLHEELLTEGAMLMEGVDIDIRFGHPIEVADCLACTPIEQDIFSRKQIDFDDRLPSRQAMRREAFRLMQGYMSAIYEMTTVNHDHLLATLVRLVPFRKIDPDDLRRKTFLLAHELKRLGVHRHQSLETEQTSLLTDDRFNKYRDFLSLALDTGVLRQEGNLLVKEPAKFSSPLDLNRARIDNPIGVASNEVVNLTELQKQSWRIAWLPARVTRYLVSRYLLNQAILEYEADYRTFFRTGESKGRDVGCPILIRGKSRELGIVLVHGFLSAPGELRELADYLGRQGLWVYVIRVKGHGTIAEDLAGRTGEDWRESVDAGYAALKNICKRVIVGGFSFGGGLALDCAARVGDVAGVFAVCPPMRLQDLSSHFASTVEAWNRVMDYIHFQEGKFEYVETLPEHPDFNYSRLPVAAVAELERFMEDLEPRLAGITVPAFVIQSQGDPVVDPDGSKRLFEELGSEQKNYRVFDFDRHGILVGSGSEQVHAAIGEFIRQVREGR